MRLAEGSITLSLPLLLLGLWVLLAPGQCSQGRPSWRYISSEVVVPRKELHHGKGVQLPGWLSYSLSFGGQRHLIHMRRKRLFWSRHLVLMSQDDQGSLQVDYPFFPLDCYYLGYLEDVPLSMVTMDTCYGGLEGIMKLDDLAYEIKPLRDSQRFEHVVSQIKADTNAIGPTSVLGLKEERDPLFSEAKPSAASKISSKLYSSHRGNLKGCLMSAHSVYTLYRNMSENIKFLVQLGSLMDSMFRGIDIKYYISIMVIYDKREPTTLDTFNVPESPFYNNYQKTIYGPFRPYSGLMMIKDKPHELNYNPPTNTFCSDRSLIFMAHLSRHYLLLSIIATQQTGRTMGLKLDENTCVCQRRTTCIMNRYPVLTDAFSNCSTVQIQDAYSADRSTCVFLTEDVYFNTTLTHFRCGNHVLEDREQCDCGTLKECYENPCCQTDCKFTSGSVCNVETCCTNCSYSPPGTLCRPVANICDLPEYCTGDYPVCPLDHYLLDGTPCTEEGYCYLGNCTDRNMHCKEIFGKGALDGPERCYRINRLANRFGNCGVPHTFDPKACSPADMYCGRLYCINVTHMPRLQEHVGFHQALVGRFLCFSTETHRGAGTTDVGAVRAGTLCAEGRICVNRRCIGDLLQLNYSCPPEKCYHRGVCNNKGNCHCHATWDPPLCVKHGAGGSIDSGPTQRRRRFIKASGMPLLYLRVLYGRLFAVIASLLFGVATNVKIVMIPVDPEEGHSMN